LLTALLSASGYLVQTVATDKESKIVEVLLSSATPEEILAGKLFGLGAAGLVQFAAWTSMVIVVALTASAALAAVVTVPWLALAISPLLFVLGYLFLGSLMLATAALGANAAESQKLTMGWAMLAILPLMVLVILLEDPNGVLGQVMTWIPFTAPLTVIIRLAVEPSGVGWWEVTGAIAVLVISIWLAIRVGARLFRVGFLLTGSRPSLAELWRQAR
jgi:ABC-2 type transport system permease protein